MIEITSIEIPDVGWPIMMHCKLCGETVIVLSPWAAKPKRGDYWKIEGICENQQHAIILAMEKL